MTNKKLKMAAMSVALTACVAASPLAANADAPEATSEEPKKESVTEETETKKEETTAEPQVNQKAKNAQKTLKDAEVKYDKDNPTTNPDGSQKLDGVIVTNPEGNGETGGETDPNPNPNPNPDSSETDPDPNPNPGSGETDPDPNPGSGETDPNPNPNPDSGETNPNPNPNPDSGETDPNPNPGSGETGSSETKPEEIKPEEKKPEQIGTAEKTEKTETNVETKPNPGAEPIVDTTTPPTVEKNPDGSTTITQPTVTPGTETTTTTGTGEAKGNLDEKKKEVPKEEINLDKELGENPNISWDIKKGDDAVNDYKVEEVTNSEDGNQQTLKLKKEEETTAEMTAEDIAKLVDAEKPTVNPDGTYTLTRTETILDAEGNPQTRTTYITIQDNKVTTRTTTELTITRQKEKLGDSESFRDEVTYPSIEIKNGDIVVETIQPEDLEEMLKEGTAADDGIHFTKDGKEYVIQETTQPGETKLSSTEIVNKLNDKLNSNRYEVGIDGETIYYTTDHGEKVKLEEVKKNLLRRSITYTVTLKTKENGSVENESTKPAEESKAKMNAIRKALNNAVVKLGVEDPVKAELESAIANETLNPNGGTFEVKLKDGKTYTLTYTGADVRVEAKEAKKPDVPGKNPEDITDVMDNTVKGTAYVTKGTISWTEGKDGEYTATVGEDGQYVMTDGDASVLTPPEGAKPKYEDGKLTGYTVTSEDADGNTVTTTYNFTYSDTSSMTEEQRKELNQLAVQALMKEKKISTQAELEAAGYTNIRFDNASTVTWTVTQTTQKKTEETKPLGETIRYDGDADWTIEGDTLTYGNDVYKMKDGKFTLTVTEGDKEVTYTATEQEEKELSPEDARKMLAEKFKVDESAITLNDDCTTATFTKGDGSTVTVNCTNLKKRTLKIERSEAASVQKTVVATDEATLNAAYEELWDEIKKKKGELGKDKTLFVGDIEITDTGEAVKTEVIEYIKEHVTQADMTTEQLKAALKAQAEAAKTHMVKVNEGTKYEDTLPNYYAGDRGTTVYVTEDGTKVDESEVYFGLLSDWYWDGTQYVPVYKKKEGATYIKHLDLASGAQLKKQDGTSTDCVLVNPTLKWNYDADELVDNDPSNTDVGLESKISFDNEGGKGNGHYEYDRGKNNNPDKSAFYKVTGTVLYDAVKDGTGEVTFFGFEENPYTPWDTRDKDRARNEAFDAYLNETKQTAYYNGLSESKKKAFKEKIVQTYIVEIGPSGSNSDSKSGYQVYTKSAKMAAYGYMTRDANTCINRTYNRPEDSWEYVGGYDLMISRLVQTKEGKVVGETESKVKNIFAPLSIRTSQNHYLRSMDLTKMTTETLKPETTPLPGGSQETVQYLYDQSESKTLITEETKVKGTGEGHYKSFTNLIQKIFYGDGTGTKEGGSIEYKYHSEKDKEGNPVKFEPEEMVVTTKQDAEVHYTFTSQESRDVWIKGYTQTVVPPVNPGPDSPELPPVEDAKPAPAPEAPVLPVVQDARPDPAPTPAPAPETPVLPAVQDAKLIQTGTSGWLADLMLGAGTVLSAAGYWMERKRKAMFYKSQH